MPSRLTARSAQETRSDAPACRGVVRHGVVTVARRADASADAAARPPRRRSARGMVPFAGWEMPVQYEGVIPEHRAVRTRRRRLRRLAHGRAPRRGADGGRSCCRALLSNDLGRIGDGEAQYTLLTNERGGIVDDLIVYRIDPFHYLARRATRRTARPAYAWLKEREIRGSEVRDASDEYALLAVQGPRAARARSGCPQAPPFTHAMGEVGGVEVMVGRTGYTGERGRRADVRGRGRGRALGRRPRRAASTPCGLGARDTLRLEVCYPLHGNDITAGDRRDLGRARLDVRARQGVHRRRRAAPDQGRTGPERKLVAFVMDEKAVPRQGMPIAGGGEVTSRHALADARRRDRHGLRPGRERRAGHRARRSTSAASRTPRARRQEADLRARGELAWQQRRATPTT